MTRPLSSDVTSTPQRPCAITGALKMRSRSVASARSARGFGFGVRLGGACVQPDRTSRLATVRGADGRARRPQRSRRSQSQKVFFVAFVIFVASRRPVSVKLLQGVE